jgi:hypothetical protein
VLQLLANPSYASAYVFGRYHSRRAVDPDGTIRSKSTELPREQWPVLIRDQNPVYITWETFLANTHVNAQLAPSIFTAVEYPSGR